MSDFETMTEFITQDYIRYKLQKTGYDFENISKWPTVYCQTCKSKLETDVFTRCYTCNDANMFTVPEDKTGDAPYERELKLIREMCDASEDEFEKGFRLDTSNINPNKATVQRTLLKEADKLFEEATQWEGIVSLLILSGSLATRCAVKGYISEAKGIQRNTSWYINDRLGQWMKENGGWEGFSDWAERFNANDSGSPMKEKKQKKQHTLQTIIKTVQNKIKKKDIKATGHSESSYCLTDFAMSPNNPSVPHIIEKWVEFIEAEGLNATGIHRIPGDPDQVDLLTARFEEDSNVDISTLGIEVHAVAMVLRKFFATLTEPLVPVSIYEDLVEVSCVQDKSDRIRALKGFLLQMHPLNFKVLKFLIDHLHKVSQKSEEKSMDSKFLSHHWWPILFRVKFDSFEKMVKYSEILEDLLQTLIEHGMSFSFCPWEEQQFLNDYKWFAVMSKNIATIMSIFCSSLKQNTFENSIILTLVKNNIMNGNFSKLIQSNTHRVTR